MFGASDSNPTLVDLFGHLGIGGNSLIPKRDHDTFGAAYYYTGVSNTFRDSLAPFIRLRNESGFEAYYNVAITGWSLVAADFQFIDPFAVGSKTRGFFSVRWKLTFYLPIALEPPGMLFDALPSGACSSEPLFCSASCSRPAIASDGRDCSGRARSTAPAR